MKHLKILAIFLIGITQLSAQKVRRASRSAFERTGTFLRPRSLTETGFQTTKPRIQSSTKLFTCPKMQKSPSRSLTTESFKPGEKTTEIPKTRGSRVVEYARAHPGKVVGIVSGIGGSVVAKKQFKKYLEKSETIYDIDKLGYLVGHYNPDNLHYVLEYIDELAKKEIINERDRKGDTPVMIIIKAAYVHDDHKAKILKALFSYGAELGVDNKRALNKALGLDENIQDLHAKKLSFQPQLKTLKVLLQHSDKNLIKDLLDVYNKKITQLQEGLANSQKTLEDLQKQKGVFGFTFNREKQNDEAKLLGLIDSYQARLNPSLKLKKIAENSLKKQENRINTTGKGKERHEPISLKIGDKEGEIR